MMLAVEWLSREGHLLLMWWLWIALAGVAVLPLCLRLLAGLPDRGYSLARAIGLLLVTTVFWVLASYGFIENTRGNIIMAWALVLMGSLGMYAHGANRHHFAAWWRENRSQALLTELIFAALFLGWALYRAHQNSLVGTEKPMELAFMSAVQRSPTFPPQDPWMSGFAISYYYMGYVTSSMLATMSGVASTISFNLTNASTFALTGLCAFGVASNLVRSRTFRISVPSSLASTTRWGAIGSGFIALLLMTMVGNFQLPLIEIPYQARAVPQSYLDFWGANERSHFPEGRYEQDPGALLSTETVAWDHWWWWRASRVPTDYNLDGSLSTIHPIGEFPAFSFLLADNHPHVLALPFTIMLLGLMLNLVLLHRRPCLEEIVLYGLVVGGLAFLNAWDGPIFLLGMIGAEALRRTLLNNRGRLTLADIAQLVGFGLTLVLIIVAAYLPYVVGFRSQAGGLLPNLANPTAIQRLFVMFGPVLLPLIMFLCVETWRGFRADRLNWRFAFRVTGIIFVSLATFMLLLILASAATPNLASPVSRTIELAGGLGPGLGEVIGRHVEFGWTTLLLLLGIFLVIARLFPPIQSSLRSRDSASTTLGFPPSTGFALLLIGIGLCLTLVPQFLYLRDNFGSRINTVFKFYYQAWTVWSIAAAYAAYSMFGDWSLPRPHRFIRLGFIAIIGLSIAAGLLYSILGIYHRAWIETGRYAQGNVYAPPPTWQNPVRHVTDGVFVYPGTVLYSDGNLSLADESAIIRSFESGIVAIADNNSVQILKRLSLDGRQSFGLQHDRIVISCLSDLVGRRGAVVSEAVRDAYNAQYGRVGALTGIPIVLGWANHERQWRGPTYTDIAGTREWDMETLYTAESMEQVKDIIERYAIDYVLYGSTERAQYGSFGEEKFFDNLPIVCESGESRVFATRARLRTSTHKG